MCCTPTLEERRAELYKRGHQVRFNCDPTARESVRRMWERLGLNGMRKVLSTLNEESRAYAQWLIDAAELPEVV